MTDSESPIIDFYPKDFHIDMNGKKMLWQGVALLPFIDQNRLLTAMDTKYPELTEFENHRNEMGTDTIIVGNKHPLYDYLEGLYGKRKAKEVGFFRLLLLLSIFPFTRLTDSLTLVVACRSRY